MLHLHYSRHLRRAEEKNTPTQPISQHRPPLAVTLALVEPRPQRTALRLAQPRPVAVRFPQDVVDDARRVPAPDAAAPAPPPCLPALAGPQVLQVQSDQGHAAADHVVVHPGVQLADGRVGGL